MKIKDRLPIGENVKYYRKKLGLTQAALAERLGVSPVNISQIETGQRRPNMDTVQSIALALGIDAGKLVGFNVVYTDSDDETFITNIKPSLSDLEPLSDEETALKYLLNELGYDIIKTRGNYFFTYDCGGSEISVSDLNELLSCAKNGLKIAAKSLELKLMQHSQAILSGEKKTPPPDETDSG